MVVTIAWIHSWTAISISISVLLVVVLFLVFCLCWEDRARNVHQFYVLDEDGLKKASEESLEESGGFFRRLSNTGFLTHFRFSSSNIEKNSVACDHGQLIGNESDLMDSLDVEREFNNARLQIEVQCDDDDARSGISNDSSQTYYSVYPAMSRVNSAADTMRSAMSYPENLDAL